MGQVIDLRRDRDDFTPAQKVLRKRIALHWWLIQFHLAKKTNDTEALDRLYQRGSLP